jgi:hypothetical protein
MYVKTTPLSFQARMFPLLGSLVALLCNAVRNIVKEDNVELISKFIGQITLRLKKLYKLISRINLVSTLNISQPKICALVDTSFGSL